MLPSAPVTPWYARPWTRRQIILAVIGGILSGLVVVGLAFALYGYLNYRRIFVTTATPNPAQNGEQATPTPDPLAPFTVLLMGFGGPNHDGGYLTDTMILTHIDPRAEEITMISLPRDIWVELPVTKEQKQFVKLNHAYAVGRDDRRYPNKPEAYQGEGGGGVMAKEAVQQVTGLPVNYFVALSFAGFKQSIDVLGGVPVQVPVAFEDPLYPIEGKKADLCGITEEELAVRAATLSGAKLEQSFGCRYETLRFDAGRQTLDGETALKFVRSRHSPQSGGDFARSQRQKALLVGVKERIFTAQFLPKLIPFMTSLTREMQMDIDLNTLTKWVGEAETYRGYTIKSIALSTDNVLRDAVSSDRQYILLPKESESWDSVHAWVSAELAATESAELE